MPDIRAIINEPFRHEIVERMPEAEYRAANGISPSSLGEGLQNNLSPLYVRHAYEHSSESTKAMLLGTYGHHLLLEHDRLGEWAVWDGGDKRKNAGAWAAFKADAAATGARLIDADEIDLIAGAVANALARPEIVAAIGTGSSEVSVFTEEYGLQCKGRLDWVSESGEWLDVKFTNDLRTFDRTASRLCYVPKLAAYHRWFSREHRVRLALPKLLVIQVNERRPHDCKLVSINDADLDWGWRRMERMLEELHKAIERDEWPGIDGGAESVPLEVPSWDIPEEIDEVQFA